MKEKNTNTKNSTIKKQKKVGRQGARKERHKKIKERKKGWEPKIRLKEKNKQKNKKKKEKLEKERNKKEKAKINKSFIFHKNGNNERKSKELLLEAWDMRQFRHFRQG